MGGAPAGPERRAITQRTPTAPAWVVHGLANGTACTSAVTGILRDGGQTRPSLTQARPPRGASSAAMPATARSRRISKAPGAIRNCV